VLYSKNTFHIARRPTSTADGLRNPIVQGCEAWLESIGSALPRVQKTIVALDNLDFECRGLPGLLPNLMHLDLLPLIRILWSDGSSKLNVSLELNETQDITAINNNGLPSDHNILALNQAVRMLGTDDILDLKRYRVLIGQMLVHQTAVSGRIVYKATDTLKYVTREFVSTTDDDEFPSYVFAPKEPATLLSVFQGLGDWIFLLVFPFCYLKYEILHNVLIGNLPPILQVQSFLRNTWFYGYLTQSAMFLVLRNESTAANFTDFNELKSRPLVDSIKIPYRWFFSYQIRSDRPPTYVIKLVTTEKTSLTRLTISSVGFFRQMSSVGAKTPIIFELHGSQLKENKEEHVTIFKKILERLFLFLSDIHFHSPSKARADDSIEVYIDGHGTPVHATVSGKAHTSSSVQNTRIHLTPAQVHGMAQGRLQRLREDHVRTLFREKWKDDARDHTFAYLLGHVYRKYLEI